MITLALCATVLFLMVALMDNETNAQGYCVQCSGVREHKEDCPFKYDDEFGED